MNEPRRPLSGRWSAASGLAFVALFLAWIALYGALEPQGLSVATLHETRVYTRMSAADSLARSRGGGFFHLHRTVIAASLIEQA